jgi:hypothetical protein
MKRKKSVKCKGGMGRCESRVKRGREEEVDEAQDRRGEYR